MENPGENAGESAPGAQCAIHPGRPASGSCSRCGNFMCQACTSQGEKPICPRCVELTSVAHFALTRDDFDFSRVWDFALRHWQREWLTLSLAVLVLFLVGLLGSAASAIAQRVAGFAGGERVSDMIGGFVVGQVAATLINVLVQGIVFMGMTRLLLDVLGGRKADLSRLFSQVDKLPRYISQFLIGYLLSAVPFGILAAGVGAYLFKAHELSTDSPAKDILLALVSADSLGIVLAAIVVVTVYAVYVLMPLQLAPLEVVFGGASGTEAIGRAFEMARGHRLELFGYGLLGGLIVTLGVLVLCIGILPAIALQQALTLTLFLALRNGTGLPPPPEP